MTPVASKYLNELRETRLVERRGVVRDCVGLIVKSGGPQVSLGERCMIRAGGRALQVEVIGFEKDRILLMPYADLTGVGPGCEVVATGRFAEIPVGQSLLGRVIDALGQPLDGGPPLRNTERRPLWGEPINPVSRRRITEVFETGVKAIDALLPIGKGQRMGLFAGSGVGKSSILGMVARNSKADVNVIALIGERGREVRDFIEEHLADGLSQSVVVAATSEQSPLLRSHAAFAATAIAEYFRDRGAAVALLMDSLTRFAMARREIGLSAGEPPTARGYTPSVFALLPKLLERAGSAASNSSGSITGIYTILVEGDDFNEPISDHARATLDGHIALSREIANRGRYPAIDLLASISRLLPALARDSEKKLIGRALELLSTYSSSKDAVELGAYKSGTNPLLDQALKVVPAIERFLAQRVEDAVSREQAIAELANVLGEAP